MQKTKFDEKFDSFKENVLIDETEIPDGFGNDGFVSRSLEEASWFSRNKSFLKQIFFYFPGVFLFLIYSMGITYDMLHFRWTPDFEFSCFILLSVFLCIFGLGNIRNPKHLAIPASVGFVGFLMGIANFLSMSFFGEFWFTMETGWSLMFLPFALMSGFLAKSLVDSE